MVSLVCAGRRRVLAVLAALVATLALASACGSDSGASSDVAGGEPTPTTLLGAVIRDHAPTAADDFPIVPGDCQSPTQPMPFRPCHVTSFGRDRPTVAVWGDSHAWMYLPALRVAANRAHANLVMILAGGCPPALPTPRGEGGVFTSCDAHDLSAVQYVKTVSARPQPFTLVLGADWEGYRDGAEGGILDGVAGTAQSAAHDQHIAFLAHARTRPLFQELGRLHVRVDVIGQAATVPTDAPACPAGRDPYACDLPRSLALRDESSIAHGLRTLMRPLAGHPLLIDTTPAYCDAEVCHAQVDGVPTWYDAIHLGKGLTRTMGSFFRPVFARRH